MTGKFNSVAPKHFKKRLAKICKQFAGTEQHDAQEFLALLMDGLHEDLNRVRVKQYVPLKDSEGRPDETVAAESWYHYLKTNKSVVVDLFQGQLKSMVKCSCCGYNNVKFDPFMYLSLPMTDGEGEVTIFAQFFFHFIIKTKKQKQINFFYMF
jgi:ubiquitin C-terminal hydrolase